MATAIVTFTPTARFCATRGEKKSGALVVLHEVTRLKKLEKVRRDFVANVSHELRTPVTSIKGFVETLLDGAMHNPEELQRFLQIVATQTDRLNAIIEDLLTLSRIEQETEKAEIAACSGLDQKRSGNRNRSLPDEGLGQRHSDGVELR